jgi:hypothetical protein
MLRHMSRALVVALLLGLAGCTDDPPAEDPFAAFVAGWQRQGHRDHEGRGRLDVAGRAALGL